MHIEIPGRMPASGPFPIRVRPGSWAEPLAGETRREGLRMVFSSLLRFRAGDPAVSGDWSGVEEPGSDLDGNGTLSEDFSCQPGIQVWLT
jgi:hypothetical protein